MKKNILFFSGKRGGINHFIPLIKKIQKNKNFKCSILFTDMHLSKIFGQTYDEFVNLTKEVHFVKSISKKIDGSKSNRANQIPKAMNGITKKLIKIKPYAVIILGDRSELFSVAIPCMILNIPIIHFYGGDVSEGSTDNTTRFSLSMISNIHLVSNKYSFEKLLSLGIERKKIFNVGLLSLHQIPLIRPSKQNFFKKMKLDPKKKTIISIIHPETHFLDKLKNQMKNVLISLKKIDANKVFIYPCSDPGYDIIIKSIRDYCNKDKFSHLFKNLNNELFYNLYSNSNLIIGNSSSGILESGYLKIPALNIGNRQKGRYQTQNIINCEFNSKKLTKKINYCLNNKKFIFKVKRAKSFYYDKYSLKKSYEVLTKIDMKNKDIIINRF